MSSDIRELVEAILEDTGWGGSVASEPHWCSEAKKWTVSISATEDRPGTTVSFKEGPIWEVTEWRAYVALQAEFGLIGPIPVPSPIEFNGYGIFTGRYADKRWWASVFCPDTDLDCTVAEFLAASRGRVVKRAKCWIDQHPLDSADRT